MYMFTSISFVKYIFFGTQNRTHNICCTRLTSIRISTFSATVNFPSNGLQLPSMNCPNKNTEYGKCHFALILSLRKCYFRVCIILLCLVALATAMIQHNLQIMKRKENILYPQIFFFYFRKHHNSILELIIYFSFIQTIITKNPN